MWYRDGLQASHRHGPDRRLPRHRPCRPPLDDAAAFDRRPSTRSTRSTLGRDGGDGCLKDDERDEDGDFLANDVEDSTASSQARTSGPRVYEEQKPYRVAYAGTDWLDPDTDGDGIVDGKDDQDLDDFWNIEEMSAAPSAATAASDAPTRPLGRAVQPVPARDQLADLPAGDPGRRRRLAAVLQTTTPPIRAGRCTGTGRLVPDVPRPGRVPLPARRRSRRCTRCRAARTAGHPAPS